MTIARKRILDALPACVLAAVVIWATIWVIPRSARNQLTETTVWALLTIVSYAGWGSLVRIAMTRNAGVDLGLRVAWGMGLVCFIGGALEVPALMTRTAALVLVEAGIVLALAALALERDAVRRRTRFLGKFIRSEPALTIVSAVVGALVVLHLLSAVADWHSNPYDDDIAYLAFLRKLSDTGTVIEPFSFRRLSAYGGQTLFLELTSVRASMLQAHTFDRGVCVVVITLLMLGHRTRRGNRRTSVLFTLVLLTMLLTLPVIAINTASYYSGIVVFLGLFRTLGWAERRVDQTPSWRGALPLALLGVMACTLRQNFLPIPAIVFATSYAIRLRRMRDWSLKERLIEPVAAIVFSVVALLPWLITSYQSSKTFLFPVMPGTFHKALALNASAWNFVREVGFHTDVAVNSMPLATLGVFILAVAFVRERGTRAPLTSLTVGTVAGVAASVHGLTQSDAGNIGRYIFGMLMAVVVAVMLVAGTAPFRPPFRRRHVAAGLVLVAAIVQMAPLVAYTSWGVKGLWKDWTLRFTNIESMAYGAPRVPESGVPQRRIYASDLQGVIPAGEKVAVLVDEPLYLDFARNPIWNLDMPGYASLSPGMPFFKGSEALEAYFKGLGLRWIIFVLPEYSRYHYRRDYFLGLFVSDQEIWRTYAPYMVDFLDNMVAIHGRHREVTRSRGTIVIDLEQPK